MSFYNKGLGRSGGFGGGRSGRGPGQSRFGSTHGHNHQGHNHNIHDGEHDHGDVHCAYDERMDWMGEVFDRFAQGENWLDEK